MADNEKDVKTFVIVTQSRGDDDRRRPLIARIGRSHPRQIMALSGVVAFFEVDEFSAYESLREIPTDALIGEISRRLAGQAADRVPEVVEE